ncbi:hypothetical protein [Hymenobacter sp.]|uniref:hypothetical protein n=1 Tax=Hymenobacter sp. TaxID=1898978 RepID=UPI00286CADE9|nr:hypothetical protein [Hymenobacter sp.]
MNRPPHTLLTALLKPRINYDKTYARLYHYFNNPAGIRPDALPAHLAAAMEPSYSFKLPQLKGNVYHTLKEIVAIFMKEWRQADSAINVAIRTTRTSLAKRCRNRDPKTAYRHILTLIEHGFLRAKVQIKGGLQLLINPELLVFDEVKGAATAVAAPAPRPAPAAASGALAGPGGGLATLLDIGNFLSQKFTQNAPRRT